MTAKTPTSSHYGRSSDAGVTTYLLWPLPAFVFLISVLAVNLCYLVSAVTGQVDWCVPYVEGCVSISRAARQDLSIHLFRVAMMPVAIMMVAVWVLTGSWLRSIGDDARQIARMIACIGTIGALFLVIYATVLGTEGRSYELMRRYGVILFYSLTALDQMFLTSRLARLRRESRARIASGLERAMYGVCAVMLGQGFAHLAASHYLDGDAVENSIEWLFTVLLSGFFGLMAIAWHQTGFRFRMVAHRGGG